VSDDKEKHQGDGDDATERNKNSDDVAEPGPDRIDMDKTGERTRKQNQAVTLEWRDWVALLIASLQTVLLPLVIFFIVLVLITMFVVLHP